MCYLSRKKKYSLKGAMWVVLETDQWLVRDVDKGIFKKDTNDNVALAYVF
jgi:hypothetical protein